MTDREVISAFVDGEQFNPQQLLEALLTPDGRDMLFDFLALRHVMLSGESQRASAPAPAKRWIRTRILAAAAGIALALVGGYQLGLQTADGIDDPPAPTRVVSGDDVWRDMTEGGVR